MYIHACIHEVVGHWHQVERNGKKREKHKGYQHNNRIDRNSVHEQAKAHSINMNRYIHKKKTHNPPPNPTDGSRLRKQTTRKRLQILERLHLDRLAGGFFLLAVFLVFLFAL